MSDDNEPRLTKDEEFRMFAISMAVQTERFAFRAAEKDAEGNKTDPSDFVIEEAKRYHAWITEVSS